MGMLTVSLKTSSKRALSVWFMILRDLNTEFSLSLLKTAESFSCNKALWTWAVDIKIDPPSYSCPLKYRSDALAAGFLKKFNDCTSEWDPLANAEKAFLEAEAICRETNYRLRFPASLPVVDQVIWLASKKVSHVLGDPPVMTLPSWGPGTTSTCKGKWLGQQNKLRARPEGTQHLITAFGQQLFERLPSWGPYHLGADYASACPIVPETRGVIPVDVISGDTVVFVPKNAKTFRTITIVPHLNALIQRMIGGHIRHNLMRKLGLDLSVQPEIQKELARIASLRGLSATVDLSMASDTLSRGLVNRLLPSCWVDLLDCARSPVYRGLSTQSDGSWSTYYKHSSMGNGYTFELETLIFWALASSTAEYLGLPTDGKAVGVFGDDIILPSAAVPLLKEVLTHCGLSINADKSFHTGPFRESCGSDWFRGVQVRPVFCKTLRSSNDLTVVHNLLHEWAGDGVLLPLTLEWITQMDRSARWTPPGIPGGFNTSNELLWTTRFHKGLQRREVKVLTFKGEKRSVPQDFMSMEVRLGFAPVYREPPSLTPRFSRILRGLLLKDFRFPSEPLVDAARDMGRWKEEWVPILGPTGNYVAQ